MRSVCFYLDFFMILIYFFLFPKSRWSITKTANFHVDAFVPTPLSLLSSHLTGIDTDVETLTTMILKDEILNPSSTRTNITLSFSSYYNLMDLRPGEFVASQVFSCRSPSGKIDDNGCYPRNQFRVKLYPRGDGQGSPSEELVGMYLQYLGLEEDQNENNIRRTKYPSDTVDATFALRLKGSQQNQRQFDVEWRAGMTFVPNIEDSNLSEGYANEFGSYLMQTSLLQEFLGISNDQIYDPKPVSVELEVMIHNTFLEESLWESAQDDKTEPELQFSREKKNFFTVSNKDIRQREDDKINVHDTERVRVGKIVVPVLSRLNQRPQLFEQGAYPGVEYRILRILKDGEERFTSCPKAEYELKPVYPLVANLERLWPISINEEDIPRLYTPFMYNIISACGALFVATTGIFTAFILSQAISLFVIPSKSMDPTLQVGDVLLVDKFSPRISRHLSMNKVDDIILFSPPNNLQEIVTKNGGKLNSRDLFIKRVAATSGDKVTVYNDGEVEINDENVVNGRRDLCEAEPLRLIEKYIRDSRDQIINPNEIFVMGDCSYVSIDSRVWGPLDREYIRGRPILRLWPLSRFGAVGPFL